MKKSVIFLFILNILVPLLFCEPDMRFPSFSPDRKTIIFSSDGDLWIVPVQGGKAVRLTDNIGYEFKGLYSPDGKHIIFTSSRESYSSIYSMDADGKNIERLSFYSNYEIPADWTRDSKNIIFYSARFETETHHFIQSAKGGMPVLYIDDSGRFGKISPDGKYIAYCRGQGDWERKGYIGSNDGEIWLCKTHGKSYPIKLTDNNVLDLWPMWSDNQTVYFVSERDGYRNFYRKKGEMEKGERRKGKGKGLEEAEKISNFKGHPTIYFPTMSYDGKEIVFESNGEIWTFDVEKKKAKRVEIELKDDYKLPLIEKRNPKITEFEISQSGKFEAIVADGEIWANTIESPEKMIRITNNPDFDWDIFWKKDEGIIFASIKDLKPGIYYCPIEDTSKIKRISPNTFLCTNPRVSPNGNFITFMDDKERLYLYSFDQDKSTKVIDEPVTNETAFSPDEKWLVFKKRDIEGNANYWIIKTDLSNDPIAITKDYGWDYDVVFDKKGEILFFFNNSEAGDVLYKLDLCRRPKEIEKNHWEKALTKPDTVKQEKEKLAYDFTNILLRKEKIDDSQGNKSNLTLADTLLIYTSKLNDNTIIYRYDIKNDTKDVISELDYEIESLRYNSENQYLYFQRDGNVYKMSLYGGQDVLTFNFDYEVDITKEYISAFNLVWLELKYGFYDEKMHGKNWDKLRREYLKRVEKIRAKRDFVDIVNELLGELNASHLGFWGGYAFKKFRPHFTPTKELGLTFNYEKGRLKVKEAFLDNPFEKYGHNIKEGDYILAINGHKINKKDDFAKYLNTDEEFIEIVYNNKHSFINADTVKIKPISIGEKYNLWYKTWVQKNYLLVDELTDGKIGYLHIQSMSRKCLKKFYQDLLGLSADKRGIIIDVRNNGGGGISDNLIDILERKTMGYYQPRNYPKMKSPSWVWERPIVVLINEGSFSDAEIFPHFIKTMKLGKLVGVPTAGGVISTGNIEIIGGYNCRVPGSGWFTLSGEKMEGKGAEPDYYIELTGKDRIENNDSQLKKAIEVLLGEIKR